MLRTKHIRIAAMIATLAMVATIATPAFAATTLHIDGSTTLYPLAQLWASAYKHAHGWSITVAGGGSGKGISDAENGVVDLGMSSRVKAATDPSDLVFTAVARDAVVVVINPAFLHAHPNDIYKITPAQVEKIFRGQITNWHQLNSKLPSHSIDLMGRTGSSGTYAYFKASFLENVYKQSPRTRTYSSNGLVRASVAGDQFAIGYLAMSYVNSQVHALNMLMPSGPKAGHYVVPNKTNALNGQYIYVRDLYFVTKGSPSGNVKTFVNWCKSSAGQAYTKADYLPLH
jgi:phosphate transport system substrate-binding protein